MFRVPFPGCLGQQAGQHLFQRAVDIRQHRRCRQVQDLINQLAGVVQLEGVTSNEQLVGNQANGIQVRCGAGSFA